MNFAPEQEARLSQITAHPGTDPENLVKEAALRFLEQARRFRDGVERGIAAAERGEFVGSEEVWTGVEKILQS